MIILNDISFLFYLRACGLLKDKEFKISSLFLGNNYLEVVEKQTIDILSREGKIEVFDTDLGFFRIANKYNISPVEASNIYYAMQQNMQLVTDDEIIKRICDNFKVKICSLNNALKFLNISNDKIEFVKRILNRDMKRY